MTAITYPRENDGAWDELLYENARTRVWRRHGAQCVVCKQPLGADAQERLRHERRILERLAPVAGVAQLAQPAGAPDVIALVDSAGISLEQAMRRQPLDLPALLALALGLAQTLAAVHRLGVVHKDINPGNILLSGAGGQPLLIDFDLASTFAEDAPAFTHHRAITGTLAYLAPEQSGRTGRSVDQRADLYALGATLYQLATGQLPFADDDPLQLIHAHLARLPVPPATLAPHLPPALSDILMRLLEKEPERRYQSAAGLAHDLSRLLEGHAAFALGERDFALRLAPPSRLIGRKAQVVALQQALDGALQGRCRGVLVAGAPGVGKTALINELRPAVTARRGWFVTGKFDQYQHDPTSAVVQALRALGRLLLAEPEEQLAQQRERLQAALGRNAGLVAAALPEFAILLNLATESAAGDPAAGDPAAADPVQNEARLWLATRDLLRAIATPARPLVIVLDDLQWAGAGAFRLIDAILAGDELSDLLLVGAYREAGLAPDHPLAAMLPRWRRLAPAPALLRLHNLAPDDLGTLLGEVLRLAPQRAARLAQAIGARTAGNPYDTLELLNALRRDGALVSGEQGWEWNQASIRRYVGHGDVVDLLSTRINRLPGAARALLECLACLGGAVSPALLRSASGQSAAALEEQLRPALEDGLLVREHDNDGALRFRHDRVQQAAYARLAAGARCARHLALARRLAPLPAFCMVAATQYLCALPAVHEADEQRLAAGLLRQAAAHARRSVDYAAAEGFLAAALGLLEQAGGAERSLLIALETERHAALFNLGRLDAADAVYQSIGRRDPDPLQRAESGGIQISSLANRARQCEAVALGLDLLRQLGLAVPGQDAGAAASRLALEDFYRWIDGASLADDMRRPPADQAHVLAAARLINRLIPAAFFDNPAHLTWLVTQAQRLWVAHGPCAALVGPISHANFITVALNRDYRAGYAAARHVLAVSEAHGDEPETSQARFLFALSNSHWFEPLEDALPQVRRAREGLLRGGDLQNACFTYFASIYALLDCAPTLAAGLAEVDAGIACAARTGNDHAATAFRHYRRLVRVLSGAEPEQPVSAAEQRAAARINPTAAANFHLLHALAAAICGPASGLIEHAAAAARLIPYIETTYATVPVHLLQALALAQQVRAAGARERAALLAEFDLWRDWMAQRAAAAPGNFLHLLRWLDAERAWATGNRWGAICAFDAALSEAQSRQRPWHRALISERAGLFHLEHGMERAGRRLLDEARRRYADWGADAKVLQLERQHGLHGGAGSAPTHGAGGSGASADAIDLLAILRASQALSSETSMERLRSRVTELLGAMTGATAVTLALWHEDERCWYLPPAAGADAPVPVEAAGARGLLPVSAFRYAERTLVPLLVADATRDDRFARDPYVAGLKHCSLLVVPILSQGVARAMLLLENRLSHGAFSAGRLDAVLLVAGQLTVSLENARLYASLERKVAERTAALEEANRRLTTLSVTDPLTGLPNRRRLAEVLEAEWLRALRTRTSIGAVMVDIDQFKLYNDHYGHAAGDACLRLVAATLDAGFRHGVDLVARYGGEEFAIILPGADYAMTSQAAERARLAVAALHAPHLMAAHGIVTVSMGIATLEPSAQACPEQLFKAADSALYAAKQNGRNQVAGPPAA